MNTTLKPGYKQTELGPIPEDWETATIREIASFIGGSQPPRSTFKFSPSAGYIRLIQIRDYKSDNFETYISESLAKKKCSTTDIMIGRYGPPIFQILRGIEGAYNVALIKAVPHSEVDQEFLYNILRQEVLFLLMDSLSQRSSGQTGVELPALKAFRVALPPLPEQRAIAATLSDMDSLLDGLDRLIAKKRDIKQATMQQLLTGKTRLPGFEMRKGFKQTEVGMISEDWDVVSLDDISTVTSGKRLPEGYCLTNSETPHPYIRVSDMRQGGIDAQDIKYIPTDAFPAISRYRIFKEDLFISVAGTLGLVGKIPKTLDGANLTENADRITNIRCNQDYLLYTLLSPVIQDIITSIQTVGAQPKLALVRIRKFKIPLPPTKGEQAAIAGVLADMDAEMAALEQRRRKTRDIKQAMMQELLTGRTRLLAVNSAETQPVSTTG